MAPNTLYGIESGERIPRLDTVERLAAALGLSPSMLAFGIEQPAEPCQGLRSESLYFRLASSRHAAGLSLRDVSSASDTSVNFVRTTEMGGTMPSLAKVEALAKALDVSPCWLAFGLGPEDAPRRGRPPRAPATEQPNR